MKAKYMNSYAQLTKFQNQIRVQLNRVRPRFEATPQLRRQVSHKRLYQEKYSQTSICEPPEERCRQQNTPTKRYYQKGSIIHQEQNKSRERRHYQKSYNDQLQIASPLPRKTSAYLNVQKTHKNEKKYEPHHTSLFGIGQNDKSLNQRAKSGKRIFPSKYTKLR